ncbi:putative F-box protein At1g32420 [Papaver somniferum]|uniref:putative F-box protein At1g32420 n=1 Tax=Papaver somniferum TaxID=3469 RepID=UPI000E70464F|nr:putative F-box protein At1g32420 [Papaver somniferum]XP_026412989.1 putative F-box protein At1g32420 [Papaver somniferum]XP_026412990.1 putative F-box protein At1g32420 [Papaver somniferum]XP_026412991.1 putative F-box protein At1g32420 [Papaver somniferum]
MECKGGTEVQAVAAPGNKKTSAVNRNKGSYGDDISSSIHCLLLNKDNLVGAGNSSCSNRLDDDTIVCEMLSRLPVKSLTRFKCVCKHWLYLIEQDPYFIDLHLSRSNTRTSLFYVISPSTKDQRDAKFTHKGHDQFLLTADLSFEGVGRVEVQTIRKTNMFRCNQILGSINGLICFVDTNKYAVRIYNISTREASPWIHSKLLLNEKEKHPTIDTQRIHGTSYRFGYDPATKEYKVLCIWRITFRKAGLSLKGENDVVDDYDKISVCEILTSGNSTWRKIDAVPPCNLGEGIPDVYANGSIYWCTKMWLGCPISIAAFDFGTEKFRMIEIPKLIRDQPLDPDPLYHHYVSLLELDGCLGIIRRISDYVCKLWIFNDDHHRQRDNEKVGGEIWSEETIPLPFPWDRTRWLYFSEVVGTYELILRDYQIVGGRISRIPLYSYHRKEKSFKEIKTDGSPFLDPDAYSFEKLTTYVENLVPVRQQRRNN